MKQARSQDRAQTFWDEALDKVVASSLTSVFGPTSISGTRQSLTVRLEDLPPLYSTPEADSTISFSRRALFELVWALVLSEHTNTEDVVFGTVGRDETFLGAEVTAGCLDQTYLLRVQARREAAVQELDSSIESYHTEAASQALIGLKIIMRVLPLQKRIESAVNYNVGCFQCLAPGLSESPVVLKIPS